MPANEFTVSQNTALVEQATVRTPLGMLDDIERRAKASVATGKIESGRAESAESQTKGASSSSAEGSLYGNLAAAALETVAPGVKSALSIFEIADSRLSDKGSDHDGPSEKRSSNSPSAHAKNIEDVSDMKRSPGLYRVQQGPSIFGAGPASVSVRKAVGEDLVSRANITKSSLQDQGKDAISSWAVKDAKIASVAQAKKLTFSHDIASELALQSVNIARAQHSANLGARGPGGMGGMDLISRPKGPSSSILDEPREKSTDTWGGTT